MTVSFSQINNQQLMMQRLKAAQNRVEKLQTETQAQQVQNNQVQQQKVQEQPQSQPQMNALEHTAAMNIYNNKDLNMDAKQNAFQSLKPEASNTKNSNIITELEKAKAEVQTQQKLVDEVKGKQTGNNTQDPDIKKDPDIQQLPAELKNRPDIKNLVQQVGKDALLNPDQIVDGLVQQALTGNKAAFVKLDDCGKSPYEKLQESAGKGVEKVLAQGESNPKVLEMIAGTPSDKAEEAAAKLLNLANYNPKAQEGIERLAKSGAISLTKTAENAKNLNPADTASSLNMLLLRGSLGKADRIGAIGILGDMAKESPTGPSGAIAAKGLTKAVKSEPLDIARTAATHLKEAAMNGNDHALNGLQRLAASDDPSRAQLAMSQLGKIAMSGTSSATAGFETIKSAAEGPKSSGKLRNQAVNILGNVANQGGANGKDALQSLSDIAVNKTNPAAINAFSVIGNMNNATVGSMTPPSNAKKEPNLSDSDTFKKVMSLQQQMKSSTEQPGGMFGKFMMQFAPAM